MEKVNFTFKNGHTRVMAKRQASLLANLGHGSYLTRDMAQQPMITKPMIADSVEDLDAMDKEQLHELAKRRGVKVHHLAGADKVRAALRESE